MVGRDSNGRAANKVCNAFAQIKIFRIFVKITYYACQ